MPIFHLKAKPDGQGAFELSPEEIRHWVKARRAKSGDILEVWLPQGKKAQALLSQQQNRWFGKIVIELQTPEAPLIKLHLGVGLIRWTRLEWLVEKLTELGVEELSLISLQNSRFSAESKISEAKLKRLEKIVKSACEQSERFTPLKIYPPQNLSTWLKQLPKESKQKFILLSRIDSPTTPLSLDKAQSTVALIGPEGGFTDQEIELAKKDHFETFSLGPRVLRSETAALALAGILGS